MGLNRKKWQYFKKELPHKTAPFSKRNWGHPLHSLCSFQGKLKPAIAHHLIDALTQPGDKVVDPFAGSGTIPFEACIMGRTGLGIELSGMAKTLASAKVTRGDLRKCEALLERMSRWIDSYEPTKEQRVLADQVKFNGLISSYFHPDTFEEILAAREFFLQETESSTVELVKACVLHILHGNRPYALSRRSHPITPYSPTGPTEYKSLIDKTRQKLNRSFVQPFDDAFVEGACFQADSLESWPQECGDADAVITSPPFFDSQRFYMTNWMRFWFSGWERDDFDVQPAQFLESRQKNDMNVYNQFFQTARTSIKPSGIMCMHLGLSRKSNMADEISKYAHPFFEIDDLVVEDVTGTESHGIRDKGTVTGHSYLLLRPI